MKKLSIILITIALIESAITANAAPVPRESAPCNATEHQIIVAESYISGVLDEVKNGMGYAEASAKSNRIFFNAWLNSQTSGYSYGELTAIAKNGILQCRCLG